MKGLGAALSKRPEGTDGWEAGHEPAVCPRSTESQLYPGLHQKKRSWQVEGGDTAPLLCSGVTSPGVLHPDVESSVQERCDLLECVQRDTKNAPWAGTLS